MKNSQLKKFQFPDSGIKLELSKIKTFLETLGNPQDEIPYIVHIAGTNGKGSTLAFLQSLLQENPFKIAKYTSPHLISVTERFWADNHFITQVEFTRLFESLEKKQLFSELSYFEQLTALGFVYFSEKKTDLLLLETGLGGRLDATNIIEQPTLCLITNIGLDHQEFLGNSLSEIATEKAGILKPNTPFITSAQEPALSVIREKAKQINAPEIQLQSFKLIQNKLGLQGKHQLNNALLATNAYTYLNQTLKLNAPLNPELLYKPVNYPGRFQKVTHQNCQLILDGAHNPSAAAELKTSLPQTEIVFLLGFLKTKNYQAFLLELLKDLKPKAIILTNPSQEPFNADLEMIEKFLRAQFPQLIIKVQPKPYLALTELVNNLTPAEYGIVTGSLYLVGQVLQEINKVTTQAQSVVKSDQIS